MLSTPKILHLKDAWKDYALRLLSLNPEWWGRYHSHTYNYFIYRRVMIDGVPTVEIVFSFSRFRQIVDEFFLAAKVCVIEGEAVNLGNHIGKICARRVERNHANKQVNWGRTNLQEKIWSEEKQKMVPKKMIYFTEDDYSRIGLHKTGRVKNETVYEFVAAENNSTGTGFKQEFVRALNKNPLLKYRYIYFPLHSGQKKAIQADRIQHQQTAAS